MTVQRIAGASQLIGPSPSSRLGVHVLVAMALAAIVLLAYANSFQAGFVLDNKTIILASPRLRAASWENLKLIFTQEYWWPVRGPGLYRPLTTLSYLFNYSVIGNADQLPGYHVVNILLHWVNAMLVYGLALTLTKHRTVAFFSAVLFAVHPVCTEAVTNVVGRADLLAALFVLSGLLLYIKSTTVERWRKVPWLAGVMAATTLGVFSKENAVALPGILVLYDFVYRFERKHRNGLANLWLNFWGFFKTGYLALVPPLLIFVWVRQRVFASAPPLAFILSDNSLIAGNFWTARLTAIKIIGKYFWLLFYPRNLSPDYSFNQIPLVNWRFTQWEDWQVLLALVAIVGITTVAIRNRRRNPAFFFLIVFFFVTLLPTSNLIALCGATMAERFLYLPSVGYAICIALLVSALCQRLAARLEVSPAAQARKKQVLCSICLGLLVIGGGARTFLRNYDWKNDVRLWDVAVQVCPNSYKCHAGLAEALYDSNPDHSQIDRAIAEIDRALAIYDADPKTLLNAGHYYRVKGDLLNQRVSDGSQLAMPQSIFWYNKSLAVLTRDAGLERAINEQNRQKLQRSVRNPDEVPEVGTAALYDELGTVYLRIGQGQKAIIAFTSMRRLAPTDPAVYRNFAHVYLSMGMLEQAAINLWQASFLGKDGGQIQQLLFDVYTKIDPTGCAVVPIPNGHQLNRSCPLVHDHICAAYYGLAQAFLDARNFDLARQAKQRAIQKNHCSPEPFAKLMPGNEKVTR